MTGEEFGAAVRGCVAVLAAVQANRIGQMTDAEHVQVLAEVAKEAGGAEYLVVPMAAVALRLASMVLIETEDDDLTIDQVLAKLGSDMALVEFRDGGAV